VKLYSDWEDVTVYLLAGRSRSLSQQPGKHGYRRWTTMNSKSIDPFNYGRQPAIAGRRLLLFHCCIYVIIVNIIVIIAIVVIVVVAAELRI